MLEVAGLSFAYPEGGHRLQSVDLSIGAGEVCCLLGPNGAGKTTLLRCLLGLLTPAAGTIRILGSSIEAMSSRELSRRVAYVPQATSTPFPFTALDMAVMGRTPHIGATSAPSAADRQVALDRLRQLGIGHLAARPFARLSGGERQLTLLARALVQEAAILILDEPTAALDYGNEVHILETVAGLGRQGRTVVMTTHQPSHALAYATRAVLMDNGVLVAYGTPGAVLTPTSLSDLYGVGIHVADVPLPGGATQRICFPLAAQPTPTRNDLAAQPAWRGDGA